MDQGCTCATHAQTELTGSNITHLERDNRARVLESASVTTCSLYDRETYVGAAEKACFYTGLPSVEVLDVVFRLVEQHLPSLQKLGRYQQMLLCVIRLRMNYLFKDIAFQLRLALSTVYRCTHAMLDVLYSGRNVNN